MLDEHRPPVELTVEEPKPGATPLVAVDTSRRGIETRSIDYVPLRERHGRIWHLLPVWVGGQANIGTVAVGASGILAGGNLIWTIVAVVAGCAFGVTFSALHSTQGPRLGLPQLVQTRPQLGYYGSLLVFVLALANYIAYLVFTIFLAGESITTTFGTQQTSVWFVVVGVLVGVLALVGYDWIHRVARWVTPVFVVVFVLFALFALPTLHMPAGAADLGAFSIVPFLVQFSAAAGYGISWAPWVSDYTRYLPPSVSPRRMFVCTYFGMTIGAVWLAVMGSILAAAFPDLGSVAAVAKAGDEWLSGFGGVAVIVAMISLLTIMTMTVYGASLTLITAADTFVRVPFTRHTRAITIAAVSAVSIAISLSASEDILSNFGLLFALTLYAMAPWTAVNLVDFFVLRHGQYSVREIFRANGLYRLWNWHGLSAYAIGFAAEIPFMSTQVFTGPVARALDGADIAAFIGLPVAAAAYWLTTRGVDFDAEKLLVAAADHDLETPAAASRERAS